MKVIIYTNCDGELNIVHPSQQFADILTIEEIAHASVPAGTSFKVIDASEIPEDRTFRNAWEFDTTTEPDGVGVDEGAVIAEFAGEGLKLVKGAGFVPL